MRILIVLLCLVGTLPLFLPHIGINIDVVMSGSMEPLLPVGSLVFTNTNIKVSEPGDIIVYKLNDNMICHRIAQKTSEGYITKGDANDTNDIQIVTANQIIGKVVCMIPFAGYIVMLLKCRTVFGVLLLMIIQELIFLIIQMKGERRKRRRKFI